MIEQFCMSLVGKRVQHSELRKTPTKCLHCEGCLVKAGWSSECKTSLRLAGNQIARLIGLGILSGMTNVLLSSSYNLIPVGCATVIHFLYPSIICVTMLLLFMEAIIMAFQTGVGVFVGQNLGAKQYDRILNGLHQMLLVIIGVFFLMAVAVWLFMTPILGLFLSKQDPVAFEEAMRVAQESMYCILIGMVVMTPMYIYRVTIQSLGHAGWAAVAGFGQMVIRIATISIGPTLIGIIAYYIPDCMAWAISLPFVSTPCYKVLSHLKQEKA